MTSATEHILSPCAAMNFSRSGTRAIVPSSFMTSQMTPAGIIPARRQRSTAPSVCPARTSTPPSRARRGKTCPGETRSSGRASGSAAREDGVRAVGRADARRDAGARLDAHGERRAVRRVSLRPVIGDRPSASIFSRAHRQADEPAAEPRHEVDRSGVTFSAATTRSPSFSRPRRPRARSSARRAGRQGFPVSD